MHLGQYELVYEDGIAHRLGAGKFGEVYKGRQKQTGEIVAVKIVKQSQKSLDREIEILRQAKHANLLCLFDVQTYKDFAYLIVEYCDMDLDRFRKNYGSKNNPKIIDLAQMQAFTIDMANGLKCLHDLKIIHRDLKPANILLKKDSSGSYHAKLADFGLAREVTTDESMQMSYLGTPLYMAPEVAGHQRYSSLVDMWSLGVIMYECLYGQMPLAYRKVEEIFSFASRYTSTIPYPAIAGEGSELAVTCMRALIQFDPKERMTLSSLLAHPFIKSKNRITYDAVISSQPLAPPKADILQETLIEKYTIEPKSYLATTQEVLGVAERMYHAACGHIVDENSPYSAAASLKVTEAECALLLDRTFDLAARGIECVLKNVGLVREQPASLQKAVASPLSTLLQQLSECQSKARSFIDFLSMYVPVKEQSETAELKLADVRSADGLLLDLATAQGREALMDELVGDTLQAAYGYDRSILLINAIGLVTPHIPPEVNELKKVVLTSKARLGS